MADFVPSRDWDSNDDYTMETLVVTTDHGVYRAAVTRDMDPQEPDFDGGCPVVQIDSGHYSTTARMTGYGQCAEYTDGLPREASEIIEYFTGQLGGTREGIDTFERYLKIFHDGNLVEFGGPNNYTDYTYVAYVTRALWESWGCAGEVGKADKSEWEAYIEGDVYGVEIERASAFDEDGEPTGWTEIDGVVWGYYGEDNAKENAEMELRSEIKFAAKSMLPLEG